MGNCQTADAATVVIHHPGNKIERVYCSLSANQTMNANPGHYVALVVTSPTLKNDNGTPLKQLKLLRPNDTLLLGQVYRLISFEDVLKEFAAKKCVKLGKLIKNRGGIEGLELKTKHSDDHNTDPMRRHNLASTVECDRVGSISNRYGGKYHSGVGQWRPALQTIAEI